MLITDKNKDLEYCNYLGKKRIPFIFIVDFDMKNILVAPVNEIDNRYIMYNIRGFSNIDLNSESDKPLPCITKKYPVSYNYFKKVFDSVHKEFVKGNTFLLNLTFRTAININCSLEDIFFGSVAKYKLFYDNFTVFSPETFINIKNESIFSYPMKGTIKNTFHDAEKLLLNNEKEFAEHITIVDLIRNDLGMVSKDVRVNNFRYIDKIKTNSCDILQTSTEIEGVLENNWHNHIGTILYKMLPAGSISGAPKKKTIEIIKKHENYLRGYYTGIFGYYNGTLLDSGVMIRYIEKSKQGYFYKSGGGITVYSDTLSEYQEYLDKIYVPIG